MVKQLLAISCAVALVFCGSAVVDADDSKAASQPTTQPDEISVKRQSLIDRLQQRGAIGEIRVSNHVGKVEVFQEFVDADFKTKQSLSSMFYAWCVEKDPKCELLRLTDGKTGKTVGVFSAAHGGLDWK